MIFFLHTPKTAGTSFYNVVKNNHSGLYTPKWESSSKDEFNVHLKEDNMAIRLPGGYDTAPKVLSILTELEKAKLKHIDFIGGHVGYGFHSYLPDKCTYICFVRSPEERVISDFKEHNKPGRYFYNELKKNNFQINHYLKLLLDAKLDNYLTRQVAGPYDFFLKERQEIDQDLYRQSLKNTKSIRFFDMSKFNESLYYLEVNFGWLQLNYKKKNVSPKSRTNIIYDKELMELVTKYDCQLLKHIVFEEVPSMPFWRKLKNKINW